MISFSKEDTMNKCLGCGAVLQNNDPKKEGYVCADAKHKDLCERCFRIQHYNEYKRITKDNNQFIDNLEYIKKTGDLTVLVIDLFQMNQNIQMICEHCSSNLLVVFTKRDILPLSVSDEKLKAYTEILGIKALDTIIISSNKNYGLDDLYAAIHKYQVSQYVYVIGYTNSGKSTLINHMIQNYSDLKQTITTSMLSSTTLGNLEIPLTENVILVDTPGILEEGNICEQLNVSDLKKILPKKEIKPITYQIKTKQSIWIESWVRIDTELNNLTIYVSNQLKIVRTFHNTPITHFIPHVIRVKEQEDIVISGLGFIKVGKPEVITVYTLPNVLVYTRKSLI